MTKEDYLLELGKSDFDDTIARFMRYKNKIGNGSGAGKLFENIVEWHTNRKINGWFALKLDLSNSDWCVHDVLVSTNSDIVNNYDEFLKIKLQVQKQESDSTKRLDLLHKLLNLKWGFVIGVSAKTYKKLDVQLTTSNEPREILDSNKKSVIDGTFDVGSFLYYLSSKTNEHQLILALNTFNGWKYRLTNLDFSKLKGVATSITFEQLKKHNRFYLNDSNGNKIIDFKYGGKTANAYQRGAWVCNTKGNKKGKTGFFGLMVFDKVKEGSYEFKGDAAAWDLLFESLFVPFN